MTIEKVYTSDFSSVPSSPRHRRGSVTDSTWLGTEVQEPGDQTLFMTGRDQGQRDEDCLSRQ